jgi:hypothetical protein
MRDPIDVDVAPPSALQTFELEEDRTLRRIVPVPVASPLNTTATFISPPSSIGAVSSGAEMTLHDVAPNTEPSPSQPRLPEDDAGDEFDMPTRTDQSLRKLVEQELELQRKRRGPPK